MEIDRKQIEDSLEIVGKYFIDVKNACLEGHYKIETKRLTEEEEVLRCIKLYAILNDIDKLTGRKLEVLSYYLLYGYSKKTKKDIIKSIKMTDSNLNNVNHELRKMGVINSVGYNQSTNEVNKDLLEFKKFIVDNRGNYVMIKISK